VVNSNISSISHGFGATATYWSKSRLYDIPVSAFEKPLRLMLQALPELLYVLLILLETPVILYFI